MKELLLAGLVTFGLLGEAAAQEADAEAGKAYAEQVCAACHAVLANEQISPLPDAGTHSH